MRTLQKLRHRVAHRGLRWMDEIRDDRSEETSTRVRAHAILVPVGDDDGAMLVWLFDRKPGASQALFVRLTEAEADAVYSADPYSVGLLEPVRRHLKHPWAVLAVKCGAEIHATPWRIPRFTSEDGFIELLDGAAATCPVFMLADRREMVPEVQVFAQNIARDFAFA